ncbi:uncharacterized protein LOC113235799 [Hyposmocoma kahamanoa]|uniref:uncharacterized protein LOC113235799 n=1 Tax=Hyposmocoma kahamanoa TaxID=1477025 RepID=UPI000E6D7441|nr:uncharacterized protein LOC113235799 [Hyposmocoma kahamanoa]
MCGPTKVFFCFLVLKTTLNHHWIYGSPEYDFNSTFIGYLEFTKYVTSEIIRENKLNRSKIRMDGTNFMNTLAMNQFGELKYTKGRRAKRELRNKFPLSRWGKILIMEKIMRGDYDDDGGRDYDDDNDDTTNPTEETNVTTNTKETTETSVTNATNTDEIEIMTTSTPETTEITTETTTTKTKRTFPRQLLGCYDVIKPCISVCHAIFRTFCNEFGCTDKLKINHKLDCTRLCYKQFRNARITKSRKSTVRRALESLRLDNNNRDGYYDYDVEESTNPYSLDDTYFEYSKSDALFYRKSAIEDVEDFVTDKMDDYDFEYLGYTPYDEHFPFEKLTTQY